MKKNTNKDKARTGVYKEKWDFVESKFPWCSDILPIPDSIKHQRNICIDAFDAGVASAQRWVSVNDKPPGYCVPVLLRFVNGSYEVGYYLQHKERDDEFYSYSEPDIEFILQAVTHWRYIDIK
jgi:hypothetical protein